MKYGLNSDVDAVAKQLCPLFTYSLLLLLCLLVFLLLLLLLLLQVLVEVARSIQYVQSLGLIHCDIKPGQQEDRPQTDVTWHVTAAAQGVDVVDCAACCLLIRPLHWQVDLCPGCSASQMTMTNDALASCFMPWVQRCTNDNWHGDNVPVMPPPLPLLLLLVHRNAAAAACHSENVLLRTSADSPLGFVCKLCDFGLVKLLADQKLYLR
jgi:serine/threonine protein kinase